MSVQVDLIGARVLRPGGFDETPLHIADGVLCSAPTGRAVDLSGFSIVPGIVDVHGDGFERHVAPRRGAMKDVGEGIRTAEIELAANGVTTGVLAQFISWEAGLRGPEFAAQVFDALAQVRGYVVTDIRGQVRLETHLLDEFPSLPDRMKEWGVSYLVFNDHLPHDRLATGRKPPRLNGQALRAGRSPELHLQEMMRLHQQDGVDAAVQELAQRLTRMGVRIGSHDDGSGDDRRKWHAIGASISEFPEDLDAASAARENGDLVVMGAPNIVRGGSHNGNVSALDLVAMGLCDALASDYHYPSLRRAALFLARAGVCSMEAAWGLISSGPAQVLGLTDRGTLQVGKRADLVVLDGDNRVAATLSGGRISHMSGVAAERFVNADNS